MGAFNPNPTREDYLNYEMRNILEHEFWRIVHLAAVQERLDKGPRTVIAIKSAGKWIKRWKPEDLLYFHGIRWSIGNEKHHELTW